MLPSGADWDASTLLLLASAVAAAICVVLGTYLWWPTRKDLEARSQAGSALFAGAVVAIAVFFLQLGTEVRFREIEERRANERAVQDLKLQVAVQDSLEGFDFRDVRAKDLGDLSRFYFRGKKLMDSDFRDVTLNGADFTGANLRGAKFDRATLHDATLISANLESAFLIQAELQDADLTTACLRSSTLTGANLARADLTGADLSDAEFDAETVWTNGRKLNCSQKTCFMKALPPRAPTPCPT